MSMYLNDLNYILILSDINPDKNLIFFAKTLCPKSFSWFYFTDKFEIKSKSSVMKWPLCLWMFVGLTKYKIEMLLPNKIVGHIVKGL